MLERMASAKQVEFVEERTRTFTDIQLNDHRSEALEEVGVEEWRYVVKYFNWWQLRVIAAEEHGIILERELSQHVQQGSLCHKYLVDAKRRVEETFLTPVLEPAQVSAASNCRHAT